MNKNKFEKLIKLIVEEVENEVDEMWMSTKECGTSVEEAGLTSEKKELLKGFVKKCIAEYFKNRKNK